MSIAFRGGMNWPESRSCFGWLRIGKYERLRCQMRSDGSNAMTVKGNTLRPNPFLTDKLFSTMPHEPIHDIAPDCPDDTPAFATSSSSMPGSTKPPSLSPASRRKCRGCTSSSESTYDPGCFCSAMCTKKVGACHKWAAGAEAAPVALRLHHSSQHSIPTLHP